MSSFSEYSGFLHIEPGCKAPRDDNAADIQMWTRHSPGSRSVGTTCARGDIPARVSPEVYKTVEFAATDSSLVVAANNLACSLKVVVQLQVECRDRSTFMALARLPFTSSATKRASVASDFVLFTISAHALHCDSFRVYSPL